MSQQQRLDHVDYYHHQSGHVLAAILSLRSTESNLTILSLRSTESMTESNLTTQIHANRIMQYWSAHAVENRKNVIPDSRKQDDSRRTSSLTAAVALSSSNLASAAASLGCINTQDPLGITVHILWRCCCNHVCSKSKHHCTHIRAVLP